MGDRQLKNQLFRIAPYHYEEWREGDRKSKKSKYIPKTRRSQIQKMNDEKVPVEEILKVLSQIV